MEGLVLLLLSTLVVMAALAVVTALFANALAKPRIEPPAGTGGFSVDTVPKKPRRVEPLERGEA